MLQGKVPAQAFAGKIVLIGTKSENNSNDYAYTPYARRIFTNPKLAIHGHIVETLIANGALVTSPLGASAVLTFLLTAFVVWLVFNTQPTRGVAVTVLLGLLFVLFSLFIFRVGAVSLDMAHPLLGIFFAYYVFVPYRLIMEFQKRADFQNKHETLMQVDELKRNFMSLITHDLKTPVARIQGLAEMLGRAGSDRKIVGDIVASTDELNRFITSILELAKVETNHVKLVKATKDINRLVEDVVGKQSFQARQKSIELVTDLEPLFPIPMDSSLVSKILTNLIDNAIKYSPEGSNIVVSSRESSRRGFIEISVADNGPGIEAADLKNLFHKFYRPQKDISMQVKGYGLGLYLSRYFAELHKGALEVESEPGKGSKFTLFLPEEDRAETQDSVKPLEGGAYA